MSGGAVTCKEKGTETTPGRASGQQGTVVFPASDGTRSRDVTAVQTCALPISTGAVSTSCAVSFTPNAVAIHTITASYSGDTTHAMSSGTTVVTALTHATTTGVNCMPASVPVGSATSCTSAVNKSALHSHHAPACTLGLANSRGTFSASSCTLGIASTDPTTSAVSTLSLHDALPISVAIHTITASYSGDTTHAMSSGTTVVTALTHATTTGVNCMPASVPVGSATSC